MSKFPFSFDTPADSPGFLLWQTTTLWQRLIKQSISHHNISHSQFVIMAVSLWFDGQGVDVTQSKIINISKLDKMTVSKSLKKLTILGLVERYEHIKDNRTKTVKLTSNGKKLTRKLVPIIEGIDAKFFGNLAQKKQDTLVKILRNLVANIIHQ